MGFRTPTDAERAKVAKKFEAEILDFRARLLDAYQNETDEFHDYVVYHGKEEYDPDNILAIAYLVQSELTNSIGSETTMLPFDELPDDDLPSTSFLILAATHEAYDAFLAKTGQEESPAIRANIERRRLREIEVKKNTGRIYVPTDSHISDLRAEMRKFREEIFNPEIFRYYLSWWQQRKYWKWYYRIVFGGIPVAGIVGKLMEIAGFSFDHPALIVWLCFTLSLVLLALGELTYMFFGH